MLLGRSHDRLHTRSASRLSVVGRARVWARGVGRVDGWVGCAWGMLVLYTTGVFPPCSTVHCAVEEQLSIFFFFRSFLSLLFPLRCRHSCQPAAGVAAQRLGGLDPPGGVGVGVSRCCSCALSARPRHLRAGPCTSPPPPAYCSSCQGRRISSVVCVPPPTPVPALPMPTLFFQRPGRPLPSSP